MTLNQEQLFEISDCKQQSKLLEWLHKNGIKYTYTRKGRVITTYEQFNIALADEVHERIEFD